MRVIGHDVIKGFLEFEHWSFQERIRAYRNDESHEGAKQNHRQTIKPQSEHCSKNWIMPKI